MRGALVSVLAVALLGLTTTALIVTTPAGAGTGPSGERCGTDRERDRDRCVGPVTDESGGGGGTVTIVVSVVVGLAVAGVAFVLLRRQFVAQPSRPSEAPPTDERGNP